MTNRLDGASSAYLQSAAHQPVAWYPWGDAAFAAARAADQPILLDIGAVWCHWCHVMDGESYENPALAELLNQHYVCIKVDRDERPDVDARYQRAVQAMTGQGGWPLTAILTPDGEVFYGGTYFPPEDRYGRPGFRAVLEQVRAFWREHRARALEQAAALRRAIASRADQASPGVLTPGAMLAAERAILAEADPAWGGFGTEPKFPHPGAIQWLMGRWADGGSSQLRLVAEDALRAMTNGGIHDQVAGGFHRYSVDRQWIIPHFEKMSYDNSELLRVYAGAAALFDDAEHAEVAQGIVRWVREVLADPAGGYGTSQDADIGLDDDGSYFTWTREEMARVLTVEELAVAERRFGLGTAGVMPHGPARNVLFVAQGVAEIAPGMGGAVGEIERVLAGAIGKLAGARAARRPVPAVDRSRYTSWNAMMASAMLRAAPILKDPWARVHAIKTLTWLRDGLPVVLPSDGLLPHSPGGTTGLLEDQVHAAHAAVDAFETTGDTGWLDWAMALMEAVWRDHWDPVEGGCFDVARERGGEGLLDSRLKPIQDAPVPSSNGVAGIVLGRLHAHTGADQWGRRHQAIVEAFAARAPSLGLYASTWLLAADWLLNPVAHLVVTGPVDDATATELHRLALAAALPRRVVRRLVPGQSPEGLPPELRSLLDRGDQPRGYLCIGTRCLAPAEDPAVWRETIGQALGRFQS